MMKKLFFVLFALSCVLFSAQKKKKEKYEDILMTKDIQRIEEFLQTAHPEDPRRIVLKPKLIALKNAAWTEGRKTAKPMAARPIEIEIPNSVAANKNNDEVEEFKRLVAESSSAHKEKTAKLLTELFNNDITSTEVIILVQNNSDCNMIMRFQGGEFYNLAVPAKSESSLVVKKGDYQLTSNVCDAKYTSNKNFQKHQIIILNNPVVNPVEQKDSKK